MKFLMRRGYCNDLVEKKIKKKNNEIRKIISDEELVILYMS